MKILVIEDDRTVGQYVKRGLEEHHFQADLVGLKVVNVQDEELGVVAELFENGAHPVMRIVAGATERLLPFVEQVVRQVDMAGGRIRVEWELDW